MTQKPLLISALSREQTPRPPIWMMRQAGRYLSEYRELKDRWGFLTMCMTPEIAAEVTLQPVRLLDVDAAILFSDILIPARALGIEVSFNPGPVIANPVRSAADVSSLKMLNLRDTTGFVSDAVAVISAELGKQNARPALIGFAGAPWTLACYLIDQRVFKHYQGTQVFFAQDRAAAQELLNKITAVTIDYLLAQAASGADAVQLFDSWGGILSLEDYRRFSLPAVQEIFAALKKTGVKTILYVNGSAHLLEAMAESGADCLSIDCRTDLRQARRIYGSRFAVQGNFDPTWLFSGEHEVAENARRMLEDAGSAPGYIANLGHGILPLTPRENAFAFVNAVRSCGQ